MATRRDGSKPGADERFHDRLISLLLAAIWAAAMLVVRSRTPEIPAHMFVIGTIFFVTLVPAMKELVKIIDRCVRIQLGLIEPTDE